MLITEVTESMLPLFLVEVLGSDNQWKTLTSEPFATEEEARKHIVFTLTEYPTLPPGQLRVAPYTIDHWRKAMVQAIFEDDQLAKAVLVQTPTNLLIEVLKTRYS